MRNTIADMTKAGLVSHICRYHNDVEGPEGSWDKTIEYAMREFRDLDSQTINRLIAHCRAACLAARMMNHCKPGEVLHPDLIPKIR